MSLMPHVTEPPLSLTDYLNSLDDRSYRDDVEHLFHAYDEIINQIHLYNQLHGESIPEIRITFYEIPLIETGVGVIYVSVAFLQKCLNVEYCEFNEVVNSINPLGNNTRRFITSGIMSWALAHECFHSMRKHSEVIERLSAQADYDPVITSYALESDADMCAIAVIYRLIQNTFQINDMSTRQLAIYIVYWGIRPDFALEHSRTHISMGLRAYNLICKLSILTIGRNDVVDINFARTITRKRHAAVFECFIACENHYLKYLSTAQDELNFRQIFERDIGSINSLDIQIAKRWDEIREVVAEISGTQA